MAGGARASARSRQRWKVTHPCSLEVAADGRRCPGFCSTEAAAKGRASLLALGGESVSTPKSPAEERRSKLCACVAERRSRIGWLLGLPFALLALIVSFVGVLIWIVELLISVDHQAATWLINLPQSYLLSVSGISFVSDWRCSIGETIQQGIETFVFWVQLL